MNSAIHGFNADEIRSIVSKMVTRTRFASSRVTSAARSS